MEPTKAGKAPAITQRRERPTTGVSCTTSPAQASKWYANKPIFRLCRGRLPQIWDAPPTPAGLAYLIHRCALVLAVASNAVAMLIIFTFDSLGVLVLGELGLDAARFGLTIGSIGLGTAAGAIAIVPYGYVAQVETPPALLGRVFATAGGIQNALLLLMPPLFALLAERWVVGFVFAAAGSALALLGLVVCCLRPAVATPVTTEEAVVQPRAV